jgi:hypothetical protein
MTGAPDHALGSAQASNVSRGIPRTFETRANYSATRLPVNAIAPRIVRPENARMARCVATVGDIGRVPRARSHQRARDQAS